MIIQIEFICVNNNSTKVKKAKKFHGAVVKRVTIAPAGQQSCNRPGSRTLNLLIATRICYAGRQYNI